MGAGNKYVLKNGTVVGTGDGYGVLDFYQNEGVLESSGTSALNGQLRFRNAGQTTEIKVTDGELSINNGAWGGGTLLKTGEGILTINQAVSHGATILKEAYAEACSHRYGFRRFSSDNGGWYIGC